MTTETQRTSENEAKKSRIWVFAGSTFHNYYTQRFVTHRFNDLQQAAQHYYKKDGYFELPMDLCIAPLPCDLTTEESKWIAQIPYVLLEMKGWAESVREPMYKVKRIEDIEKLKKEITNYINRRGENRAGEIVAGISFDLAELVQQVSNSTREQTAQDLIERLGLSGEGLGIR